MKVLGVIQPKDNTIKSPRVSGFQKDLFDMNPGLEEKRSQTGGN